MLLILPFKVLKLVCHVLLEACQIVRLQATIGIIKLFQVQYDIQKRSLAIEVICVPRVSNFICDAINLDLVFWHTLENHCSEHGLFESYIINNGRLDSEWANIISVTYSLLCVLVL